MSKINLKYSLSISLLALSLFIIRYYDMLFTYKVLGNSNDSVHLLGPVFKHVNNLSQSGQTPLFFQELLGGIPFFNNAMFSFTYPFYFFNLIDYGNGMDVLRTITLIIAFHLFVLYISNIVLLRVIGFNWLTSILASFGIILCLNTTYNTPWIIAIAGYAWTPLFFAGIIACIKKPKSYLGVILLTIGSFGFLAKPAQTAILAIVFGAVIALIGLIVQRKNVSSILPKLIIAGLLIIGFNSVGLLQLFIDFPDMMRFTTGGAVAGNSAIPLEAYKSQVAFSQIGDYILYITKKIGVGHPFAGPIAIGSFFASIYFLFVEKVKTDWIIKTFLGITIFTIIIAFGKELPTFWIHYKTPLLNKIRESTRFLFITNIGFTVLIAYVLNLVKVHWEDKSIRWIGYGILALGIVLFFVQLGLFNRNNLWMFVGIPMCAISFFILNKKPDYRLWITGITMVLIGFSFVVPNGRYGKQKQKGFENKHNLSAIATFDQLEKKVKDVDSYRCMYSDTHIRDGEWSNKGLYNGFRSLQGTTVVLPFNQYEELWHSDKFLNYRLFWGAKWHFYSNDLPQPKEQEFSLLVKNKNHSVYEHSKAFPRAYFSDKIVAFDGDWKQFRNKLNKQKKLPRFTYINKETIQNSELSLEEESNNKVNEIDYFNNTLSINTNQDQSGLLVLNEYFSKHWKAEINGETADLIKVNINQMAVLMPAGNNELIVEYKPYPFIYFYWLQKVSYIILALLSILYLFQLSKSKKRIVA